MNDSDAALRLVKHNFSSGDSLEFLLNRYLCCSCPCLVIMCPTVLQIIMNLLVSCENIKGTIFYLMLTVIFKLFSSIHPHTHQEHKEIRELFSRIINRN